MTIDIRDIAGIVRTHAASQPNNVALIQGDRTQTWGQLYVRACKVANALKAAVPIFLSTAGPTTNGPMPTASSLNLISAPSFAMA